MARGAAAIRRLTGLALLAPVVVALGASAPAGGDPAAAQAAFTGAGPHSFAGVWLHAGREEDRRSLERAIERTAGTMPVLLRTMARTVLRRRTRPPERYEVGVDGGRLWIRADGRHDAPIALDGQPQDFEADDGEPATRAARLSGGVLEIRWWRADGEGSSAFRLAEGGESLVVTESIENEHFRGIPLEYSTTYRRGG